MNGIVEQAQRWIEWLKARPPAQRFETAIPSNRVFDDSRADAVDGQAFEPEASYFSVRIAQLHLRNGGEYFRQFLPMAVTLSQFSQMGEPRTLPFFLNNDKLQEALGSAGAGLGLVNMKDVYAMRYVPVNADGLSLFCGLFRTVHQDFAAALLDLLAEVGNKIGGSAAAQGAAVAQTVYARLGRIVGLRDVEFLFGNLDGNALANGSGYRVFAGPGDPPLIPAELAMAEGKLCRAVAGGREEVRDGDYCVVAIERLESRAAEGHLTTLPLHKNWVETARNLAAKRGEDADAAFNKLQAEVLTTPDLTEADRLATLAYYQKKWTQTREALTPRASLARSGGTKPLREGLQEEIERRKASDVTRIAGIVADELQVAAGDAGSEDVSTAEVRRLLDAFKDIPISSS